MLLRFGSMIAREREQGVSVLGQRSPIQVERPVPADAAAIWRLAMKTKVLEVNSSYAYLLWARDFATTSALARHEGAIVGFVNGYLRPSAPDTLFVWQIGVAAWCRGQGVARAMLDDLVGRRTRFLEASVAVGNEASTALFSSLARAHGVRHVRTPLFTADLFPDWHESEELHRLGPWPGPDGIETRSGEM